MESAAENGFSIFVPAITLVEITYLVEKGRLPESVLATLVIALQNPENVLCLASLDLAVSLALKWIPREQVPDMPERIIGATALSLALPLVIRDDKISSFNIKTIW